MQALAPRLVSRRAAAFLRYCRKQAELYGGKGARAAAARQGLAWLQEAEAAKGSGTKLATMEAELAAFADAAPHTALVDLPVGDGRVVRHLDLCGRRVPLHATVKAGREMAARLLAEYGARSLGAEQAEGVRILHAIESGSRAWGFPSRDSDYDVRFVFVRPLADYLRVSPLPDVIERPIDELLDLGGWDLRKALGLMLRSNAVVGEWLASPVVYRSDAPAVASLRALAHEAAHVPALAHHYDRLARRAWAAGTEDVRLKSYFYALRPALALRWLRDRGTPPPMDLPALLNGVAVPEDVRAALDALLARKALATEADTGPRDAVLERFLAEGLAEVASRPAAWDQDRVRPAADALFQDLAGLVGKQG